MKINPRNTLLLGNIFSNHHDVCWKTRPDCNTLYAMRPSTGEWGAA
jgi:hypothetical protein